MIYPSSEDLVLDTVLAYPIPIQDFVLNRTDTARVRCSCGYGQLSAFAKADQSSLTGSPPLATPLTAYPPNPWVKEAEMRTPSRPNPPPSPPGPGVQNRPARQPACPLQRSTCPLQRLKSPAFFCSALLVPFSGV